MSLTENESFKDFAPVCLSTYSRLLHLQQTVSALQKNILANQTELFIFSDGPKEGDEDKVNAVRKYLKEITGFKKIHIYERVENNRVKNNRGGMADVLNKFGRLILIEEDVVTAPNFLLFMNEALKRYEHDKRVFSISGWSPALNETPPILDGTTFFVPRLSAWGLGIWKDRFDKIKKISVEEFKSLKKNPTAMNRVYEQMGSNILSMLYAESHELINALDVRSFYYQAITGELTLYPYPTLARNIGLDGTGEHCKKQIFEINGRFKNEFNGEYLFQDNAVTNAKFAKIFSQIFKRKLTLLNSTIDFMESIRIYHYMRPIVKKIQNYWRI